LHLIGRAGGRVARADLRDVAGTSANRQTVPLWNWSAGQAADVPLQFSAMSHGPPELRQVVVAGWKPSAGQAADVPVQFSATSQGPIELRQVVVAGRNAFAGQAADVPVQFSASSHSPRRAPAGHAGRRKSSDGQVSEVPLQFSATSHGPADGRQVLVVGSGETSADLAREVAGAAIGRAAVSQQDAVGAESRSRTGPPWCRGSANDGS
jgi:hypothetical protein